MADDEIRHEEESEKAAEQAPSPETPEEDYESEGVSTLEYVLRGTDMRTTLLNYLRVTPWWLISVASHCAAGIVLIGLSSGTGTVKQTSEDLLVQADIKREDPEPLDLAKLEKVFEEMKKIETEKVIVSPMLVQRPEVEMTEAPRITEDLNPDNSNTEFVENTDFTSFESGAGEDGNIGDVGLSEEDVVGVASGIVRGKTNYDSIMGDLSTKLSKVVQKSGAKAGGNILLVWIMDASVSMKDDQQAIRERLWEMDKKFREQKGSGDLKQAVIYYGDRPNLWLQPTSDVEQVMEAIDNIEINPPGTVENTMQAVIYAAQQFDKAAIKAKRVGILVDDDSPDDSTRLEEALGELKKAKMTLFVINRECPFQSEYLYEAFEWVDEDGDKFAGTGTVHRGPETARPEVTGISFGSFFWGDWSTASAGGRIPSGFGIYDISRLGYYTGGAYYILDPKPHDLYNWDLMESYRPELVSRDEYDKRTVRNPYKRVIEQVTKQWNQGFSWSWRTIPQARENVTHCENRLVELEKLIRVLETEGRMSDSQLASLKENRRWPANADLVWSSLVLARHRLRQFLYGLEEFLKTTRSIPEDHYIYAHGTQKVKETPKEKEDREAVIQAMRYVANRHPRTPWGYVASSFDPNSNQSLYGWLFNHAYYFQSYWARLVTKDDKVYTAYVTGEDKKKDTITFTVPKKGTKTTPKSFFKSITPIPTPSGASYNPHPRI
jgi:hypothetical protein